MWLLPDLFLAIIRRLLETNSISDATGKPLAKYTHTKVYVSQIPVLYLLFSRFRRLGAHKLYDFSISITLMVKIIQ